MKYLALIFSFLWIISSCNSQEITDKEEQIKQAVMAVAEKDRADCTVYGFTDDGTFVKLREGTNRMICIADDPTKKGFSVACYHKELDPFMARGRQLKSEGKTSSEIFDIREEEVKSKKLPLPDNSTLSVLSGKFDEQTGEPIALKLRYVFYIPFATSESTGLPTAPVVEGGPWIMDPGTHKDHIMINPKQ
ncbi:MAG: hypothetical protein WBA74_13795 [Cyclobacteriaceae bacterium]